MVCDIPDWVDCLLRRSRRDENFFPFHILFHCSRTDDMLCQKTFIRKFSAPHILACKHADSGFHNLKSVLFQRFDIILRNRILVHRGVHGRRDNLRARAGKHRCRQHVIGKPMRKFCHHICRCRRDKDNIRLLCQRDMLHLILKIPVKRVDQALSAGQCLKRDGIDKVRGIPGHHDLHRRVLFYQKAREVRRLICRNAAAHAQQYCFSF